MTMIKGNPVKGTQTTDADEVDARKLEQRLADERHAQAVHRNDELARRRAESEHARALADLEEQQRRADRDREQREAAATSEADLAREARQTYAQGQRTHLAVLMTRSAEGRIKGLRALQRYNLVIVLPFVAFAAASTAGVQHGLTRLTQTTEGSFAWYAWWVVEPALLTVVAAIIVFSTRLTVLGGTMNKQAETIQWGCLIASIVLNLAAAEGSDARGIAASAISHAVWPCLAALMAHLIGVISQSIADTDAWTEIRDGERVEAPSISKLLPETFMAAGRTAAADDVADVVPAVPPAAWPVPVGSRTVLPIVANLQADVLAQSADITAEVSAAPLADAAGEAVPAAGIEIVPASGADMVPEASEAGVRADLGPDITVEDILPAVSAEELWERMPQVSTSGHDTEPVKEADTGDVRSEAAEEEDARDDESLRRRLADMLSVRPDLTGDQIGAVLGVSGRHGRRLKKEVLAAASQTNGHQLHKPDDVS